MVEYPVLIGWAMWLASWIGHTPESFLIVTSAGSSVLAVGLVLLVRARVGARVRHLLLAPPLVLYAFHNWDLLAIVPAVGGLLAFEAELDGLAGVLLAIGASAKVFPGLLLIPLVASRAARNRSGARRVVVGAVATTLVLNVPVLLASPSGWWFQARFQGSRSATWGTLWFWLFRLPVAGDIVGAGNASLANFAAASALIVGLAALSVVAWRRHLSPYALAAAALAIFLLTNKVYSPNYDLWMTPFFALVAFPTWVRRGFGACSVGIFIVVYGMFHGLVARATTVAVLPFLVVPRAGILVAIVVLATRSSSPEPPQPRGGAPPVSVFGLSGVGRVTRWHGDPRGGASAAG